MTNDELDNPPRRPWEGSDLPPLNELMAKELVAARARITELEAERDAAIKALGDRMESMMKGRAEVTRLRDVLARVTTFLEHRYGNDDGDDWHDTAAGDLGDLIEEVLAGGAKEEKP